MFLDTEAFVRHVYCECLLTVCGLLFHFFSVCFMVGDRELTLGGRSSARLDASVCLFT